MVTSHVFGYRLAHGATAIARPALVASRCDEPSCHNPAHWRPGDVRGNTAEHVARHNAGPLADRRGPAGRARAIATAIRAAIPERPEAVKAAITRAATDGLPQVLTLFRPPSRVTARRRPGRRTRMRGSPWDDDTMAGTDVPD